MSDELDKYLDQFAPPAPAKKTKNDGSDVARIVNDELANLGWAENARLSLLGDLGRENAWNRQTIFGGHSDPKNKAFNRGIISWQGDRRKNLDNYLKNQGVLGRNDDDELRAMVRFMDEEMRSSREWQNIHKAMRNPNISTYDASENLRKYIKYVPDGEYNSYDSEFRVKNNKIWAEKARKLDIVSGDALDQYLDQFAPQSAPTNGGMEFPQAQYGTVSDAPMEMATPENLAKLGLQMPQSAPTNPQNVKLPGVAPNENAALDPLNQGIINRNLSVVETEPVQNQADAGDVNPSLVLPPTTENDYLEYLKYTGTADTPATKAKFEQDANSGSYGVGIQTNLQIPQGGQTDAPSAGIASEQPLTAQTPPRGQTQPLEAAVNPQPSPLAPDAPMVAAQNDREILDGAAGAASIDLRNKPKGENTGRFLLRTALEQIAPEYGLTTDEINQAVERSYQKYGKYSEVNDNVTDEMLEQSFASGKSSVNFTVSNRAINDILRARRGEDVAADDDRIDDDFRRELDFRASFSEQGQAQSAYKSREIAETARMLGAQRENLDSYSSLLNTEVIKQKLSKIWEKPSGILTGEASLNDTEKDSLIKKLVEDSINSAGSAQEAQRIVREYDEMSGLEKGIRHSGDFTKAILKFPASFAKTLAWAEDGVRYLREQGIYLPTLTTTDILESADWLWSKTLGLPEKQGAEKRELAPTLLARAIENTFPEDKYTKDTVLGKIASTSGNAAAFMIAGAATGGGAWASALLGMGAQIGEQYDEARRAGVSRERQLLGGLAGIPLGASEALGFKFGKFGGVLEKATNGEFSSVAKKFLTRVGEVGREGVINSGEEFLQELGQTFGSELVTKALKESKLTDNDIIEAFAKGIDSAKYAAISGGAMGAGTEILNQAGEIAASRRSDSVTVPEETQSFQSTEELANQLGEIQKRDGNNANPATAPTRQVFAKNLGLAEIAPDQAEVAENKIRIVLTEGSRQGETVEIPADDIFDQSENPKAQGLQFSGAKNTSNSDTTTDAAEASTQPNETFDKAVARQKIDEAKLKLANFNLGAGDVVSFPIDGGSGARQNGKIILSSRGEIVFNNRVVNDEDLAKFQPRDFSGNQSQSIIGAENLQKPDFKTPPENNNSVIRDFAPEDASKNQTLFTERNAEIEVTPMVIDDADILTSFDDGFPQELQPRDRSRIASELQIEDIAKNLNPKRLGDTFDAGQGRPVLVPIEIDGQTKYAAVTANGRATAIRRNYDRNNLKAAEYRAFALSKGGDENLARPVYAAVINNASQVNLADFAEEANEGASQLSAVEQASSDAKKLDSNLLNSFEAGDDGNFSSSANQKFSRAFFEQVVGKNQQGRFVTDSGELSQEGVTRIKNAIFAKAFADSREGMNALAKIAEDPDINVRNIANGFLRTSGAIAKFKEAAGEGSRHQSLDITESLAKSLEKYSFLRDKKIPVDVFVAQRALPGQAELSPLEKAMILTFDEFKRSGKAVGQILNNYYQGAEAAGDPNQLSMFGAEETPDALNLWQAAVELYEEGRYEQIAQTSQLFAGDVQTEQSATGGEVQGVDQNAANTESNAEKVNEQSEKETEAENSSASPRPKLEDLYQYSADNQQGLGFLGDEGLFAAQGATALEVSKPDNYKETQKEKLAREQAVRERAKTEEAFGPDAADILDKISDKNGAAAGGKKALLSERARLTEKGQKGAEIAMDAIAALAEINEAETRGMDAQTYLNQGGLFGDNALTPSQKEIYGKIADGTFFSWLKTAVDEINNDADALAAENENLDTLFESVLDEVFGQTEQVDNKKSPKAKKSESRTVTESPQNAKNAEKTAKDLVTSAGAKVKLGIDDAVKGLNELFSPDKFKSSSFPAFDEKTYEQAKPYFQAAFGHFKGATNDLRLLLQTVVRGLQEQFKMDRATVENMRPYIYRFVQDLESGNITLEEQENVANRGDNLEQNSAGGESANTARQGTVSARSGRADRGASANSRLSQTGEKSGQSSNLGLSESRPAVSGEVGNPKLFDEEPANQGDSPRNIDAQRIIADSNQGVSVESVSNETTALATTTLGESDRKLALQREAEAIENISADLNSIRETLPFLLPEQQDDVQKAEQRFAQAEGILFTNGTGTGKTYTGLGIAKRFAKDGKTNILIVAPNDKILEDWQTSGKNLMLDIKRLKDTDDNGGENIVQTTYANFGQNPTLIKRQWDLIIFDESHYLSQNQDGDLTGSAKMLRAISLHPRGKWDYKNAGLAKENIELENLFLEKKLLGNQVSIQTATPAEINRHREITRRYNELNEKIKNESEILEEEFKTRAQTEEKTKVVFLSATPFAYEKNIEYAEGYLFSYDEETDSSGYNSGDRRERFFTQHFGYRMRYNKLTRPDAEVNTELMERQFNTWLKRQGALSGRRLTIDADYSRTFVLAESSIGQKIDEGFQFLFDNKNEGFRDLSQYFHKRFDYLHRRFILEAINARASIEIVKKHLALGRKVVVFHDYNVNDGFHPFGKPPGEVVLYRDYVNLSEAYEKFAAQRPDLVNLDLRELVAPTDLFKAVFGNEAKFFNGRIDKKLRREFVKDFNRDDSDTKILVVQSDAGREGISLHDTTGRHQRVLINLGLPTRPIAAIQTEGRIYRTNTVSNAIQIYMTTGTNFERYAFGTTISARSSTAENLALGEDARALKESFIEAYQNADDSYEPNETEGTGGKEADRVRQSVVSDFDRAKSYYYGQQKKTSRNKSREGIDYFATPEPLGLKMTEWADGRIMEDALEPSAGHGAIARFFKPEMNRTIIEPSAELVSRLSLVTDGRIEQDVFENHHAVNKYDVVVMNPPFGTGGKTAIEHLEKAAMHLRDGGRIVALLPEGATADKRLEKFLNESERGDNLYKIADISLPTAVFERAGTKVKTHVVVLEKQLSKEKAARLVEKRLDFSSAETINEFFDRIENVELPPRIYTRDEKLNAALEPVQAGVRETIDNLSELSRFEAKEFQHSREGYTVFVARPKELLNDYDQILKTAKTFGGWYNKFGAKFGAIKGFAFKEKNNRDEFLRAIGEYTPTADDFEGDMMSVFEDSRENNIFYSQLEKIITDKMPNRAKSAQVKAIIKNNAAKQEEIGWLGISEFLETKDVFTKQEVVEFINENAVELKEVIKEQDQSDETRKTRHDADVLPGGENYRELLLTLPESEEDYTSRHFDEKNIVAHLRLNERTDADGKNTLFIEEIQSDWLQDARRGKNVPDVPFRKSWHELAFKRALHFAVANGFDAVGWTTGAQQNNRYDWSTKIERLQYRKAGFDGDKYSLTAYGFDGYKLHESVIAKDELENNVGKNIAKIIVENAAFQPKIINGNDLKLKPQGMIGFYDKIIPDFARKYVKKWNAAVETSEIETNKNTYEKIHSVRITPEMRNSVLQGQPMFSMVAGAEESAKKQAYKLLKTIPIAELVKTAEFSRSNDRIRLNSSAQEILRRALEQRDINRGRLEIGNDSVRPSFLGIFLEPSSVRDVVGILKETQKNAVKAGLGKKQSDLFGEFAEEIAEAYRLGGKTAVFYVTDEKLPQEIFHQASYLGAIEKSMTKRHAAPEKLDKHQAFEIADRTFFAKYDAYRTETLMRQYKMSRTNAENLRKAIIREEIAAWIAEDSYAQLGLDFDTAMDYLLTFMESYADKNGNDSLEKFKESSRYVYEAVEKVIQTPRNAPARPRRAERKSQSVDAGEREGNLRESEPRGPSRSSQSAVSENRERNGVAGDYTGDGRKNLASLPKTARVAGIGVGDVEYTVFGDKQARAEAQKLLEENGIDGTIKLLEQIENPDAHHAIASFTIQRTLLDEAERLLETNPTEAENLKNIALEMASRHAIRAVRAGRFIRAAALIQQSVEAVMFAAQKVYQDKYGRGATLPMDVLNRLEAEARQGESAIAETDSLNRQIKKLKTEIAELKKNLAGQEKFRKTSKANYAKRKKVLTQIKARHQTEFEKAMERLKNRPFLQNKNKYAESLAEVEMMSIFETDAAGNQQFFDPTSIFDEETAKTLGFDRQLLNDLAIFGAMKMTEGFARPASYFPSDFDMEMTAEFGDGVATILEAVHKASLKLRNYWLKELSKDKQIQQIANEFGDDLSDAEIEIILGERQAELKKRQAIEKLHTLRAQNGVGRNFTRLEEIITEIAPNSAVAVGAKILTTEQVTAQSFYDKLKKLDLLGAKDAREILRESEKIKREAENIYRKERQDLQLLIGEREKEIAEIEKLRTLAGRRVRQSQELISKELRRIRGGEIKYRIGQLFEVINTPRSLMAAGDGSFMFRQGGWLMIARPREQKQAFINMIGALNEKITSKGFDQAMEELEQHPAFETAVRSGLDFAALGRFSDMSLTQGEEEFRNNIFEKIPGLKQTVGWVIKKSDDTYTAFLDTQRMAAFSAGVKYFEQEGYTFESHPQEYKKLADYINDATGRSVVGGSTLTNVLMQLPLFSPRFTVSRFKLLYKTTVGLPFLPPATRKIVMKDAATFYAANAVLLGLAALAGASIELDWDDADFLKIKVGSYRYDLFAGLQQPARMLFRLAASAMRETLGAEWTSGFVRDSFEGETRNDFLGVTDGIPAKFIRSKLSPLPSLAVDRILGEDFSGKPFDWQTAAASRMIPLLWADFYKAGMQDGTLGVIKTLPSAIGFGVQSYPDRPESPQTPAEKLAVKINGLRFKDEKQTLEDIALNDTIAAIKARARRGENIAGEINALYLSGQISSRRARSLINGADDSYFEEKVKRMPDNFLQEVRKIASTTERELIDEILSFREKKNAKRANKPTKPLNLKPQIEGYRKK